MFAELETVLIRLQMADINAWVATAPPGHMVASIQDPNGGPDIQHVFQTDESGRWPHAQIGAWMSDTASRLYPGRLERTTFSRIS